MYLFYFSETWSRTHYAKKWKEGVVKTIMECIKSNLGSQNLTLELVDVTVITMINTVIEEAVRWGKSKAP